MAFLLPAVYSLSGHKKVEEAENTENIFIPFGFTEENGRREAPNVLHGGPELRWDHISQSLDFSHSHLKTATMASFC